MTRRRFIADTWTAATATLTGDQAAHLARVLRAEPGQVYDVVAGGFLHRAEIASVSPSEVSFLLHEELESDTALPLHLLLAVFKFDHMEWAIEKATELGVERITPILARRTEKHLAQSAPKRADRWHRIALEASKQSRRTVVPEIADPIPLKATLEQEQSTIRILLSETEQATTIAEALKDISSSARSTQTTSSRPERAARSGETPVLLSTATDARVPHPSQSHREGWDEDHSLALAIGPEGGWTQEEMSLFAQHNWQPVTLGPRILRAETAAIAAIAIASSILQPD